MRKSPLWVLLLASTLWQQSVAQRVNEDWITPGPADDALMSQLTGQATVSSSVTAGSAETALFPPSLERLVTLESQQAQWQQAVDQLIARRGIYGAGLDEAYRGYGKWQLAAGNLQQATALFRQAWQVSRINTGLYSEEQLVHLNQLIEALVAQQQWEQVHELHQLSFLIASHVYAPDDLRYVLAAEFYTSWKWQAINSNITFAGYASGFELAQELSAFYEEVIDRVEHSSGTHSRRLARLVMGKARTDIGLARAVLRSRHDAHGAMPDYITETECLNAGYGQTGSSRHCRRVQLATFDQSNHTMSANHYALGRYLDQVERSIHRLVRIRQSAEELSVAEQQWIDSLITALEKESGEIVGSSRLR